MTIEASPQHIATSPEILADASLRKDTTPSGIEFRMRAGKGKDVIRAAGMIGPSDPPMRMTAALIQIKTEFFIANEWKKLTLEEIESDLSDTDFMFLLGFNGSATKGKS